MTMLYGVRTSALASLEAAAAPTMDTRAWYEHHATAEQVAREVCSVPAGYAPQRWAEVWCGEVLINRWTRRELDALEVEKR